MRTEKQFEDRINTWVQIVGIFIAAAWGVYTFIYKEIVVPKAAPINTSLSLEIKKVDSMSDAATHGRLSLSIVVSAANPSTRAVDLFHSVWLVYGYRGKDKDVLDLKVAQEALNSDDLRMESRFSENEKISLVAAGRLFEDEKLEPGEKIGRTEILFLPSGRFDSVELVALVPSAANTGDLKLRWTLHGDGDSDANVTPVVTLTTAKKEDIAATEAVLKSHEYSVSMARSKIAL